MLARLGWSKGDKEIFYLDDLNALFWRKELAYFPQVILPGHIVTVTLYGIFDAGNEDDEEDYMIGTRGII